MTQCKLVPESAWGRRKELTVLNSVERSVRPRPLQNCWAWLCVCALETFLKAILDNWLERKPYWRVSRRKWENVGDGLSDVFSYCSLSRSISLFTETMRLLCSEPPTVSWNSRLKLMSGSSLS